MANRHNAPYSPSALKIARSPHLTKIFFDGTKLRIDPRRPKTTTYGINLKKSRPQSRARPRGRFLRGQVLVGSEIIVQLKNGDHLMANTPEKYPSRSVPR